MKGKSYAIVYIMVMMKVIKLLFTTMRTLEEIGITLSIRKIKQYPISVDWHRFFV